MNKFRVELKLEFCGPPTEKIHEIDTEFYDPKNQIAYVSFPKNVREFSFGELFRDIDHAHIHFLIQKTMGTKACRAFDVIADKVLRWNFCVYLQLY